MLASWKCLRRPSEVSGRLLPAAATAAVTDVVDEDGSTAFHKCITEKNRRWADGFLMVLLCLRGRAAPCAAVSMISHDFPDFSKVIHEF